MDNKSWYKSPEMIVGLSALAVSLVAVFVAIYSAYVDRTYARASVWPRLEIYRSYSDLAGKFEYGVDNSGTGPAIINSVKISEDGKYIKRWSELGIHKALKIPFIQSQINGRIIPPQRTITPIKIDSQNSADALRDFILKKDGTVNIEICYCSIYEECWLTDRNNKPKPVTQCDISEDDFIQ
ncbi:hypothetical protein ACFSJY_08790 [Thalassotalea euphylliae]|uniref:hypothetical protein n=1 Tax=Thalassotalea euphylliae TaxID=1655234 RepID=UPI003633A792